MCKTGGGLPYPLLDGNAKASSEQKETILFCTRGGRAGQGLERKGDVKGGLEQLVPHFDHTENIIVVNHFNQFPLIFLNHTKVFILYIKIMGWQPKHIEIYTS